jgi:hypothetical protein
MIKPVTVSVDVPESASEIYEFLDALANHQRFTDHVLTRWACSGPATGVGARARVVARFGAVRDTIDIEVVEAESPRRNRERNIGAGGRRVAYGTYELSAAPAGGTRISFTYSWEQAPRGERLLAPLVRASMRRANQRALSRLAELLPDAVGRPA